MNVVLIGLNHRTAPVEVREKLALDACDAGDVYRLMGARPGLDEHIFLSTCNRVEVLAAAEDVDRAADRVREFLAETADAPLDSFADSLYVYEGREAVRHVFRVAAGLDSMVLGEPQILGQLKDSYRRAVEARSTGAVLNKLLHKSFSAAKRVRTETGIGGHAVSVSYAAVELARKIFGELEGKNVLLIGAGEMAELAAEHLLTHGAREITVANRTLSRAVALAKRWNGRAAALEEASALLAEADIVISSTGSQDLVVRVDDVRSVQRARKRRPLFFVDIAVPRDIDPDVNRLENVYLYDIDDLQSVVEANREERSREAVRAERIVQEETLSFESWMETLDSVPTIVALKEKAEAVRRAELRKTMSRIEGLTPEQAEAVEVMTEALTRKLIHDPILFIKAAGRHGRKDLNLEIARRVLGLDRPAEEAGDEEE